MTRSRPAGRPRHRAGHALLATGLAATLGTALAAAPLVALTATAAEPSEVTADSGDLAWGFRESFRNYVGRQTAALPPIGAVPIGERITLVTPGEFDEDGTPAAPLDTTPPNETLPYLLPVTGGTVTDADNLTVASAGGAVYHFPSHAFTVTVKDVAVVVDSGVGSLVGDLAVEIPENNLGYEPGTYGGDDVVLGEVATTTVNVSADAVTVSGTGVTLTAEGASALQDFLAEGAALDDFSVSARTSAPAGEPGTEEPEEWNPTVTLSKASGVDPEGETVTATGSGFDPAANINTSGRPPVAAGAPTGVYVVFGSFGSPWRPSEGAGSGARTVLDQKWALPEPSYSQVKDDFPNVAGQLVLLNPDGTFTAELAVAPSDTATGAYGVYTYAAGGAAANAAQELGIPVSFATPGGSGDIDLEVTVPEGEDPGEPGEPGAFTWTVVGGAGAVSLGTAEAGAGALTATGDLKRVTVSDTRAGGPAWSINGTATDFFATGGSASFPGSSLGWSPSVSENTGGAVAGPLVRPSTGSGLTAGATLVSAPAGHASGSVTADAALDLRIPLETPAGDYASVLTLTAVG